MTTTGEVGATLMLLFASNRGWVDLPPSMTGAPWTALPGGWFFGMRAGAIPDGGSYTVQAQVPGDPVVRGFAISVQAAVFGTHYAIALSNGSTRVIAE